LVGRHVTVRLINAAIKYDLPPERNRGEVSDVIGGPFGLVTCSRGPGFAGDMLPAPPGPGHAASAAHGLTPAFVTTRPPAPWDGCAIVCGDPAQRRRRRGRDSNPRTRGCRVNGFQDRRIQP